FEIDVVGDSSFRVPDRQSPAAQGRALARLDEWSTDPRGRLVAGDLDLFELLALGAGAGGGAGAGLVAGDEIFKMAPAREDRRVRAFVVLALLGLIVEEGVDLSGIHRQLAARELERVAAGGPEKGAVVRNEQAGLV